MLAVESRVPHIQPSFHVQSVSEQMGRGEVLNDIKDPPFFSRDSSPVLGLLCLLSEERCLSMPEIDEKERNYEFEIIHTKVLQSTHKCTQSFLLSFVQSGVPYLRKDVEVHDSGSWHHPCGRKGALPKPCGANRTPNAAWSPKGCVVPKRDPKWQPGLGLNPSANCPLQPHFWLLPQLATAASIPGRCGPVVWSQLSPSSFEPHYKSLFGPPSWLHPVIRARLVSWRVRVLGGGN